MRKRDLLILGVILFFTGCNPANESGIIMTVSGPVAADSMGVSLIHEHILVDFIGAKDINSQRWEHQDVMNTAVPYLLAAKEHGMETLIECTPAYLGRDVLLLKKIADSSGLKIITNTGYYGARENKFLPDHAFTESADELADRWIDEWENGIEGTQVKPGFIKIGVDDGPLSEMHKKLITAAARTHLKTGLAIASHTGLATPAFEQLKILKEEGVSPEAFIWVHAQAEKDPGRHVEAARLGAWISLDGASGDNVNEYVALIQNLRDNGFINKILISHDAGWYSPGEANGGDYRGYTDIFKHLVPELKKQGFTTAEIDRLMIKNPRKAFSVHVRR